MAETSNDSRPKTRTTRSPSLPSGRYFTDTYSTYDTEPVSVLRNNSGRVIATLEEGDFSRLLATGWHFPTHFVAKARDGVTDLHGLLFFPSNFDSTDHLPGHRLHLSGTPGRRTRDPTGNHQPPRKRCSVG